jgi:hypothetical protein
MTTFTIEITDQSKLNGISAARLVYNNSLEQTIVDESGNEVSNPDIIDTDQEYVQFVMEKAAESYSKQYGA